MRTETWIGPDGAPWDVWRPDSGRERRRGLTGMRRLPPSAGLLLDRCRSIHTVGMRFTIDAVLLDADATVLAVVAMRPLRLLLPRRRVRHILEVTSPSEIVRGDVFRPTDGAPSGSPSRH